MPSLPGRGRPHHGYHRLAARVWSPAFPEVPGGRRERRITFVTPPLSCLNSHLQLNCPRCNLSPILLPPGLRCFLSHPLSTRPCHPPSCPTPTPRRCPTRQTRPLPTLLLREKHSQQQLLPLLRAQLITTSRVFLTSDQADLTSALRNLLPVLIVPPPLNLSEFSAIICLNFVFSIRR